MIRKRGGGGGAHNSCDIVISINSHAQTLRNRCQFLLFLLMFDGYVFSPDYCEVLEGELVQVLSDENAFRCLVMITTPRQLLELPVLSSKLQ